MRRIILLFLCFISLTNAYSQSGLYINDVFEGKDINKKEMVETLIKGEQLAQYHLTVFHSVKFTATEQQRDVVEKKFQLDMENNTKNFSNKQNCEMEMRNGHLFYAIAEVDSHSYAERKHISYQCSATTVPNKYNITLVYIEGYCDLKQLKKIFKN
ncbi:MAG: hypothetical protein J1F40_03810 [Prevotellaceae bacterium]|nr:hypothetical protein [Prevotellaceae bacterium]